MARFTFLRSLRASLVLALALVVPLAAGASAAHAVVIDTNPTDPSSYSASHTTNYLGVALSGQSGTLSGAGVTVVTSSGSCQDPTLAQTPEFGAFLPAAALCDHTDSSSTPQWGAVMHRNETFVLTWDPNQTRAYWSGTRGYVQRFLSDVASASRSLTSPYALTGQYSGPNAYPDPTKPASDTDLGPGFGAAQNISVYGGGCVDYGSVGHATCQFGSTNASGAGDDYHTFAAACTPASLGTNQWAEIAGGGYGPLPNTDCLTDQDIKGEVAQQVQQQGILGHTKPGYTPLIVVLTPPGIVDCVDGAGKLCSANGSLSTPNTASFCSYHGTVPVTVSGVTRVVPYVVQPWTPGWHNVTGCDETGLPPIPNDPSVDEISTDIGARLVSPLSQAHIAAITNPFFTSWFANNGAEVNDNTCAIEPNDLDKVTITTDEYWLQREFNNSGTLSSDPYSPICAPIDVLNPNFVVPSAVNTGDVVGFDGSATETTLLIPNLKFRWSFGDGTTATGPSVTHAYSTAGLYNVKLTLTDRGGNTTSLTQAVQVLDANGQPAPGNPVPVQDGGTPGQGAPTGGTGTTGGGTTGGGTTGGGTTGGGTTGGTGSPVSNPQTVPTGPAPFSVHLQLMPQSLKALLTGGMTVRVRSNAAADGLVTMAITRAAAVRAHIKHGSGPSVTIGRGTVGKKIVNGLSVLRLRLSAGTVKKLDAFKHLKVTVRLTLVNAYGQRESFVLAGEY